MLSEGPAAQRRTISVIRAMDDHDHRRQAARGYGDGAHHGTGPDEWSRPGCSQRAGVDTQLRPTPAYLRPFVRALILGATTPVTIRNECHHLMRAINGNDLTRITPCLERIEQLAEAAGFQLPTVNTEPEGSR